MTARDWRGATLPPLNPSLEGCKLELASPVASPTTGGTAQAFPGARRYGGDI